jgi:hypothetical protein
LRLPSGVSFKAEGKRKIPHEKKLVVAGLPEISHGFFVRQLETVPCKLIAIGLELGEWCVACAA